MPCSNCATGSDSDASTATRASSWRKPKAPVEAVNSPEFRHSSSASTSASSNPSMSQRSIFAGTTLDSLTMACACGVSRAYRASTRSWMPRGTPSAPCLSSSVTKNGLPCVAAWMPAGERSARRASISTAAGDSLGSSSRLNRLPGNSPIRPRKGCVGVTSSSR